MVFINSTEEVGNSSSGRIIMVDFEDFLRK